MTTTLLIAALVAFGTGVAVTLAVRRGDRKRLEEEARALQDSARAEGEAIRKTAELSAREIGLRARADAERELVERRGEIARKEEQLARRDEALDRREAQIGGRHEELGRKEVELTRREQVAEANALRAQELVAEARRKLEKLSGLSAEQARAQLAAQLAEDARRDAAAEIRKVEQETEQQARERAGRIIAAAIQRYASEFVQERTVAVVELPSDDMKGRIIGREGRNIRALEAATGIDLIIDDTPEAVVISCFNPVRREIAKLALQRLIADGRIHPARIEEVVARCGEEVQHQLAQAGEQALFDLGLHRMHPELVRLLGSLRFRSSFGQNLLVHSVEVGFIAGLIAGEIGQNVKVARRAGLLHDIGRAADHQLEGSHAEVGAQLARKYGEAPRIVDAIAAHHGEPDGILEHVVHAANELSSQRPAARREQLASYVQRLEAMEKICTSFSGVQRAHAFQYGRDVRVLVDPAQVDDAQAVLLCKDIARRIENELAYPGAVHVHVIRETRAVDYAR